MWYHLTESQRRGNVKRHQVKNRTFYNPKGAAPSGRGCAFAFPRVHPRNRDARVRHPPFTQNGNTTTTNYLYDGGNSISEIDQNGNLLAKYARTTNIDEPLAESRSGATSYYEADGLGSVTSLSSTAGTLASTYTFDSFGNMTASSGSIINIFRYTGREFDTETDLYFYRARYYDTSVGRFTSQDPIGFRGGLNWMSYTRNNPVNSIDPSGLVDVCCRQVKSVGYLLCHCFIVSNDNKTTYGGYKIGWALQPEPNYPDDNPVPKRSSCEPVPGGGCKDADSRLAKAFGDIKRDTPPGGWTYGLDGTSNTVAAEILRRAGFNYNFPWCSLGSGFALPSSEPNPPSFSPSFPPTL